MSVHEYPGLSSPLRLARTRGLVLATSPLKSLHKGACRVSRNKLQGDKFEKQVAGKNETSLNSWDWSQVPAKQKWPVHVMELVPRTCCRD